MEVTPMKNQTCALLFATLAFASSAVSAQPVSATPPHYSHRELAQAERNAHTPDQFAALAAWFRSQQKLYSQKALDEKAEWDRRQAITASPALKYPAAADSAHNLYDYYVAKADEMANRAHTYEQRLQ
jgi:hypothetical protein